MSYKARYLSKVTLFCSNKFGLGHFVQGGLEGNILQYYCKAVQIFIWPYFLYKPPRSPDEVVDHLGGNCSV